MNGESNENRKTRKDHDDPDGIHSSVSSYNCFLRFSDVVLQMNWKCEHCKHWNVDDAVRCWFCRKPK